MNSDVVVYRSRFLARRVKEEVSCGNINKTKEIKSIMDREIARTTWGSIGQSLQKKIRGTMSAAEICHNVIYHRYEVKEILEEVLQK